MKYLAKVADAELAWQEQATKIRMGEEKSMLSILEERGLVQTITGFEVCLLLHCHLTNYIK